MKKSLLILVLLQIALSSTYAQWIDEGKEEWATLNFPRAWISYLHDTKADRSILRQNYFQDTISVEEMKIAFEGHMGYTVTPNPLLETRNKGYIKSDEPSVFSYCADFFSFMSTTTSGSWKRRAKGGAKLLGNLIDMDCNINIDSEERTFSVLLYEKPKGKTDMDWIYGLELLAPKDPGQIIQRAFGKMQWFVRKLPYGTYRPLYTTDFRILPGRYYRITVNKCGWLVEDYMDINNGKSGQ